MALQAAYQQFLASPDASYLADDASLYFITTTTAFHGASDIIKHFVTRTKQLKKKKEEVLSAVENKNTLAVEFETYLEFLTSGSVYLPALDDNFLADRLVQLPIIHFVSFDAAGKIAQIRQSWDQGALLKQIEVIGRSGRNWPIRDSTEQIRMITTAVNAAKEVAATAAAAPAPAVPSTPARSRGNSALRDPHASLDLFTSAEERGNDAASVVAPYGGARPHQRDVTDILNDNPTDDATPRAVISPYAGRRPRERSLHDILVDEDDEDDEGIDAVSNGGFTNRGRSRSPTKAIAPKAGSGKNFQPVRLFEADAAAAAATEDNSREPSQSRERFYRPNPKRFNHFDFADGSDPQDVPQGSVTFDEMPKTKHDSQWSFEDFVTPQKPPARTARGQEVRHWGLGNEEMPETPSAASRKPPAGRPRRDAEMHFEFKDDGERSSEPRLPVRPRGAGHNEGLGLYENNLYKEDGSAPTPGPQRALGNITNLKDRSKMFEAHFTMADDSSSPANGSKGGISDDRKKAVQMMESNWSTFEDAGDAAQKENNAPIPGTNVTVKKTDERGIQIGGDGMGGKKSGRSWSFGDDEDEEPPAVPGKKQGTANQASNFWDF